MESIIAINFSRLKNEEHAQFHENVKTLIDGATPQALGIEQLYAPFYLPALAKELDALSVVVKCEASVRICEQDAIRDSVYKDFSKAVKSARNHFEPRIRVAANSVWKVFLIYGDSTNKSLDSQTEATNEIIRTLEEQPEIAKALATLDMNNWKVKLAEENDKLQNLMIDQYNETIGKTTLCMKNARIETDKFYRFIVSDLQKQNLLGNNTPEFTKFITELNDVIKRFKELLAAEFSRKNRNED